MAPYLSWNFCLSSLKCKKKKDGFRESLKRNSHENHYKKKLDSKGTFEERFLLFASFR